MPMKQSRRRFLKLSAAALATSPWWGLSCSSHDFDLVLTGGTIVDGSGVPGLRADLAIRGAKIAGIGDLKDRSAAKKIDVSGLVIAPGFIDFHSHSDDELLLGGEAQSKIRQGVTTEVLGQDGSSMAPLNQQMRTGTAETLRERYGIETDWINFDGYFRYLQRLGMISNAISMVGQGTLRNHVVGQDDRPATPAEIMHMQHLAREAFAQGAYGISSGLEYVPGSFATTEEIIAVCRAMNGRGIYSSHMRNEDDAVVEAIDEAVTIARGAKVALNISHMKATGQRKWSKLPDILSRLDKARDSGMTVTCDRYPYIAYNTGLSSLFPLWSRDGGRDKFVDRLRDPSLADSIRAEVMQKIERIGGWKSVMVSSLPKNPQRTDYEGENMEALSTGRGEPFELLMDLVLTEEGQGDMVGFAMSEENTAGILAYRYSMIASDASSRATKGVLSEGSPHPRTYGTFPRLLGKYVREDKLISLPEAVRKITSLPASMLGISDRGILKPGAWADVVVFDAATVADRATWREPHQYPVGIPYVLVNGQMVIDQERYAGTLPGRVIRR